MCGEQHELTPTTVPTPAPTHKNESLNVGARDICVGNDASSTLLDFDATMSNWVEIDDVPLSSACTWVVMDADAVQSSYALDIDGADGSSTHAIRQTSNAWGNYPGDNTLTGCNLLYNTSSYTNFILEAKMYHSDNDGVGLVFGWKGLLDHYQAAMINDIWPSPPADGISGPHMKLKRRRKACSASMSGPYVDGSTTGEDCYETLSYINNAGASTSMAEDLERVDVNAYYHDSYADYPNYGTATETSHSIYLIVKDNTVRFGRWDSDLSKWVMVWADVPDYAGGKVGIFTYAHQPTVWDVKITDLDATPNPVMCNGGGDCELGVCTCYDGFDYDNELTGTCASQHLLTPTSVPTPVPTPLTWSPTLTRNVGAADVCLGNDGTSTLLDFDSAITGWTEVDDTPLSGTCSWTAYDSDTVLGWRGIDIDGADGISTYAVYQSSNSWGNHPGDNTLTGCNLLYDGVTYTNFILEAKMYHSDNDGVGFVFGWNDLLDHYQAAMINDQWPSPPADGISGPHMKIKRRRKACEPQCSTPYIDGNTEDEDCYETLAYLNNGGPSEDMQGNMEGAVSNYHATEYIAYPNYGVPSETAASLYLIVKNNEVRMTRWEATEQKWVSAWAALPSAYAGGKIGLFTYAHQPTIWDVKITDLDATPNPEMCNGIGTCYLGTCDCGSNPFGDDIYSATGLCDSTAAPVAAPTSSPTMAPITVTASVALGGVACADFGADEQAVLITALAASLDGVEEEDMDIDDETGCTDTRRRLSTADSGRRRAQSSSASIDVDITTSPSSSGSDDASSHADAIQSSLATVVSSGTLDANIATAAAASSSATMASVTATSVSVATNIDPAAMPTSPLPTPLPTRVPGGSSSAGMDMMMLIMVIVGGLIICVGSLGIIIFGMKLKAGSAPRPVQTAPSMPVVALPVSAVSGGPLADQVAKQQAASGQPVIMNLTAPQQAQKNSTAI